MGNGSSFDATRIIYVDVSGKEEKIVYSRHCSTRDLMDLLAQAAGIQKYSQVALKDKDGSFVSISPGMPTNTPANLYKLVVKERREEGQIEMLQSILNQVAEQFNRALKMDETRTELATRLASLEKRLDVERMKLVELDRCKKDITDIRNQIFNAQKNLLDYKNNMSDEKKLSKKREVPAYSKYTLSQETVDYLKQPTFDMWHWEPNEMLSLLEHMYYELGLVAEFNINPATLKKWLLCIQENYRNNPFHNFRHCFCVTQMMYGMIHLCRLNDKISREDLGILLTSCVCHDLDHPGYNNTYQINARTELAVRYNDISPLENHHCAVAFQILSNPDTNIFSNVDAAVFKRIRSQMEELILATDMARHSELITQFNAYVEQGFNFANSDHLDLGMIMLILATDMARHSEILEAFKMKVDNFDFARDDNINSMKMVLIKCCDISNEVRPFEVSEPWVDCLLEEYFNQSDREKEQGLPVAPFMDREKVTKPTAQIGFIKFVLLPMFETVSKLFPQLESVMVTPLREARDRYESMKEVEEKKK